MQNMHLILDIVLNRNDLKDIANPYMLNDGNILSVVLWTIKGNLKFIFMKSHKSNLFFFIKWFFYEKKIFIDSMQKR